MKVAAIILFFFSRIISALGAVVGLLIGGYLVGLNIRGPSSLTVPLPDGEFHLDSVFPGVIMFVVSAAVLFLSTRVKMTIDGDRVELRGKPPR